MQRPLKCSLFLIIGKLCVLMQYVSHVKVTKDVQFIEGWLKQLLAERSIVGEGLVNELWVKGLNWTETKQEWRIHTCGRTCVCPFGKMKASVHNNNLQCNIRILSCPSLCEVGQLNDRCFCTISDSLWSSVFAYFMFSSFSHSFFCIIMVWRL